MQVQGVISGGELYRLDQVKLRLGLSDAAMRKLRRRGLPVIRASRRAFVSGRQLIAFLERLQDVKGESEGSGYRAELSRVAVEGSAVRAMAAEVDGNEQAA